MKVPPIITRDVVQKMISLLDWSYRLGVEGAYEVNDEGLCLEFLERTAQPGVYGLLPDLYMGWLEWSLRLMSKARSTSWNGTMSRYLQAAGRFGSNYLSCFYLLAQHFYNWGVKSYISAPYSNDIELFRSKTRVLWTEKGLKPINNRRYVDEVQMICFDLQRRDKEIWEREADYNAKKVALKEKHYEWFIRAVGLAVMKRGI